MGLTITGKSSKIELSGGYGMLLTIRELASGIAKNKEEVIKDRKGQIQNGVFVKESDL